MRRGCTVNGVGTARPLTCLCVELHADSAVGNRRVEVVQEKVLSRDQIKYGSTIQFNSGRDGGVGRSLAGWSVVGVAGLHGNNVMMPG